MNMQRRLRHLKRMCGSSFVLAMACCLVFTQSVAAISPDQKRTLDSGVYYFNYDASSSVCGSTAAGGAGGIKTPAASSWNSGAQPPYYMEQYIIEVLKDVATKKNIPVERAVTQEHVVAMVAWAYAEGGNLTNTGAFNLWNSGLTSRPDLVDGATSASGVQAYKSFDAGVEANAIVMTGSNQNRIGTIITTADSTAEQVLHEIAYYDETPGNLAWAWGPNPNDAGAVLQFNHNDYINSLLGDLNTTRKDYAHQASVQIGPGERETHYVDATTLKFNGGSSTASGGLGNSSGTNCATGGSVNCASAVGDSKILCEARKYEGIYYLYAGGHQGYSAFIAGCPDPTGAKDTSAAGNQGPCATDCSGLVSVAVDKAFGLNYMWVVHTTMNGAGGEFWQSIPIAQAQGGDIVTTPEHVEIVDHVSGDSIVTFGSHHTGTKTGIVTSSLNNWSGGAWRWTGPGSSGN